MPPEPDADRAAAAACADLLAAGRRLDALSRGLTVVGAAMILFASLATGVQLRGAAACGLVVACGLAQSWLALRVALDAALLHRLAAGELDLGSLDAALGALGVLSAARAGRPLAPRLAGALRLLRWQGACVATQVAVLLVLAAWLAALGEAA